VDKYIYFLLIFFIANASCVSEKQDFSPESEVQLVVKTDKGVVINGADIRIFESEETFLTAINTPGLDKINSTARIESTKNGKAVFQLRPERPYLLLITYYDIERKMLYSNLGISSYINPLPSTTILYVQMKIKPYQGHVLFYTKDASKLPISISLSNKTDANNNIILNKVYTGEAAKPSLQDSNILAFKRQPGSYTYSATSNDGCVWTGIINVAIDETSKIEITQCEKAYLTFFTPDVKDELLPLTVILNDIDTLGLITSRKPEFSCGDDITNTLSALRNKGLYNYLIKSKNGYCVWTGTINVKENDCKVVKVEKCEL
jgi:hypothetical protein